MVKQKETKSVKPRTQVKDLPREEKELNAEEQKKVQGGQYRGEKFRAVSASSMARCTMLYDAPRN